MNERIILDFTGAFQGPQSNKVVAIKAIRELTGIGLKPAKDIVDGCYQGDEVAVERLARGVYALKTATLSVGALNALRGEGVKVNTNPQGAPAANVDDIETLLKKAAILAIEAGQINRAMSILQLL